MLTDDLIDEDIETLLYAQVYYGKSANTNSAENRESDLNQESAIIVTAKSGNTETDTLLDNQNDLNSESQHEKETDIHFESSEIEPSIDVSNPGLNTTEQPKNSDLSIKTLPIKSSQQPCIEIPTPSTSTNEPNSKTTQTDNKISPLTAPSSSTSQQPPLLNKTKIKQSISVLGKDFERRLQFYKRQIIWSRSCRRALKRFKTGLINETEFFNVLGQKLAHTKIKFWQRGIFEKKHFTRLQKRASSEVICLSDSDKSDIEVIENPKLENKMKTKNTKSNRDLPLESQSVDSSDEDEIIYLPPLPVPIINVEDDSDSDKEVQQKTKTPEKSPQEQDDASNDFLAPTNASDKFNFSLHGSEFNDAEFVRPANLADTYETESSTSTSDFNRDSSREFINSVKTIVFNEVDFPREDIFEGSNLDKFGDLITPDRSSKNVEPSAEKSGDKGCSKRVKKTNTRASSESSSESDYNVLEVHQHLPHLSPMVNAKLSPSNEKSKTNVESGNQSSKRKKGRQTLEHAQTDFTASGKRLRRSVRLSKRRSSEVALEGDASKNKLAKRKKGAVDLGDEDLSDRQGAVAENQINSAINDPQAPSISDLSTVLSDQAETPRKKNKKKKKHVEEEPEHTDSPKANGSAKKKSKKKREKSLEEGDTSDKTVDDSIVTLEEGSGKKKAKKRKPNNSDGVPEAIDAQRQNESAVIAINVEEEILNVAKPYEANLGENVVVEREIEEGIVLIEPVIPVHTIDSSDSDDDIISLDVGNELELANISREIVEDNIIKEPDEFNIEYIQSKMSDDPEKWKILPADQYGLNIRDRGPRCRRCRNFGHLVVHCPNKRSVPNCSLCGLQGHEEPRCPNKVCFSCARPGSFSTVFCYDCAKRRDATCELCHLPGHLSKNCPDLWRRYYMTTREGRVARRSKKLVARSKQWCSGCAANGHLEFECKSYKWIREYATSSPQIFDFKDVYVYQKKLRSDTVAESSQQISVNRINAPTPPTLETDHNSMLPKDSTVQQPQCESRQADPQQHRRLPPPTQALYFPEPRQNMSQPRGGKGSYFKGKSNFGSFSNRLGNSFGGYTPYRSVFNPCSALGGSAAPPPLMDIELPFGRNAMLPQSACNSGPVGLFNSWTPSDVLTQQVSNIMNSVPRFQGANETNFSGDFHMSYQPNNNMGFGGPVAFERPPSNNVDFSQPFPVERGFKPPFQEQYGNRGYLDVPYTITREPSRDSTSRAVQCNPAISIEKRRENPRMGTSSNPQDGFISLTPSRREKVDAYEPTKLYNVDEMITRRFANACVEDLKTFLGSEIAKLDNMKSTDAKICKKKLNHIERLQKSGLKTSSVKKQIYFLYKRINMFLFGVQKLADGKRNLDYLRNFMCNSGLFLNEVKRNYLLGAYGYIFGSQHPYFDYRSHLNAL